MAHLIVKGKVCLKGVYYHYEVLGKGTMSLDRTAAKVPRHSELHTPSVVA